MARASGPILFTLGAIVLLEIVIGRTNLIWRAVPDAHVGILLTVEEKIIRRNPDPRVLIFGTSRGRDNFLPSRIEEGLGLRRGQALNLSMGGVNVYDALLTYERNRATLSRARAIVLLVDAFQFSNGIEPQPRYRMFASWPDRMAYHGPDRLRLVLDYAFRMDIALPAVNYYTKKFTNQKGPPEDVGMDEFGRLALTRIGDDHDPKRFTEKGFRRWINEFYRNYEWSPVMEGQMARLAAMAKKDGARVYLVRMPTSSNYLALLDRLPGKPERQLQAYMKRAPREIGVTCAWWEAPAEVGLTERDYRDWGHLNTTGARKWSEFIAGWLRSTQPRT